ncbi:MAG: hypothetical protein ABIO16_11285 [Nocardioides sp.]
MNQTTHRQDILIAFAGVAAALGLGAVVLLTGPALYGAAEPAPSPYARPVQALDGQTLAMYLADHQSNRLGPVVP